MNKHRAKSAIGKLPLNTLSQHYSSFKPELAESSWLHILLKGALPIGTDSGKSLLRLKIEAILRIFMGLDPVGGSAQSFRLPNGTEKFKPSKFSDKDQINIKNVQTKERRKKIKQAKKDTIERLEGASLTTRDLINKHSLLQQNTLFASMPQPETLPNMNLWSHLPPQIIFEQPIYDEASLNTRNLINQHSLMNKNMPETPFTSVFNQKLSGAASIRVSSTDEIRNDLSIQPRVENIPISKNIQPSHQNQVTSTTVWSKIQQEPESTEIIEIPSDSSYSKTESESTRSYSPVLEMGDIEEAFVLVHKPVQMSKSDFAYDISTNYLLENDEFTDQSAKFFDTFAIFQSRLGRIKIKAVAAVILSQSKPLKDVMIEYRSENHLGTMLIGLPKELDADAIKYVLAYLHGNDIIGPTRKQLLMKIFSVAVYLKVHGLSAQIRSKLLETGATKSELLNLQYRTLQFPVCKIYKEVPVHSSLLP